MKCFRCNSEVNNRHIKCVLVYLLDNLIEWIYNRFGYGIDWRVLILILADNGPLSSKDFALDCRTHFLGGKITQRESKRFLDFMIKRGLATKTDDEYVLTQLGFRLAIIYGPNSAGLEHMLDDGDCCDNGINDAIKNGRDTTPEIEEYLKGLKS